ncbi:hypothetical protein GWK47_004820 [Chionoecetes opilio]|uniref:Uncharacterized protein n=1 Tax=Chionoecetes opilio TaxID=41210 RepID=A0A8J4YBQ2_CHIOP|nr:hypothetical protein GWK47_004820 [Chionoecetes opilio]
MPWSFPGFRGDMDVDPGIPWLSSNKRGPALHRPGSPESPNAPTQEQQQQPKAAQQPSVQHRLPSLKKHWQLPQDPCSCPCSRSIPRNTETKVTFLLRALYGARVFSSHTPGRALCTSYHPVGKYIIEGENPSLCNGSALVWRCGRVSSPRCSSTGLHLHTRGLSSYLPPYRAGRCPAQ